MFLSRWLNESNILLRGSGTTGVKFSAALTTSGREGSDEDLV